VTSTGAFVGLDASRFQIIRDFGKLGKRGLEVFDDLAGDDVFFLPDSTLQLCNDVTL